ncbi:MAG: sterol desaturase family protein [Flavobacteriales bacterium]|nr:sterol desaturase family protein [Flavobacteriales bacterium]
MAKVGVQFVNYLSGMKSKVLILVGSLVFLVIAVMVAFYFEKIILIISEPKQFIHLLLDATHLSDVLTSATLVSLGLMLVAIVVDLIVLGWDKSGLKKILTVKNNSVLNDLVCYLLGVIRIFDVLSFVFSLGLAYFVASVFYHFIRLDLSSYINNEVFRLTIVFILLDLKHYLAHRFMHIRPFWELHAYHHSATEFTLLTTSRGHVLEGAIYVLFSGIFYALIGGDELLFVVFYLNAVRECYQYVLHSDVNWKLGWVGKYFLISPVAHRLHHSIETEDYDHNYGTFLVWWDKLFRTYKEPKDNCQIGIDYNPYNEVGYLRGQWLGMKRFLGIRTEN